MGSVVALLYSLAVVAVAGAGLATTAGLARLREKCFATALLFLLAALALPLLANASQHAGLMLVNNNIFVLDTTTSPVAVAAFTIGHVALGVALLRRWLRARGGSRHGADTLEQARGRGRPRLSPDGNEAG